MSDRTCVWPGCRKRPEDADLPICDSHAHDVVAHLDTRRRDSRPPARQRVSAPANPNGSVYYLLVGDLVKIGFTVDLWRRLSDYPPNAILLAVEPGAKSLERQRHHELRHSRNLGREWFIRSGEVQERIAAVISEHGEPKVIQPVGAHRGGRRHQYPVTVTRIGT